MLKKVLKWEHSSIEVLGELCMRAMYFYIKPINNNTYYNRESLELIKNLQSLGVGATGRLSTDRQTLQIAEYQKLKQTLGPSNEQRIQNAPVQFDTMLQAGAQPQAAEAMAGQNAISVQKCTRDIRNF